MALEDIFCIAIQSLVFGFLIFKELFLVKKINLIAIIVSAGFLVLVTGQAIWLLTLINAHGEWISPLGQKISATAAHKANLCACLAAVSFLGGYFKPKRTRLSNSKSPVKLNERKRISSAGYSILIIWTVLSCCYMIYLVGGMQNIVLRPGINMVYGVSMVLILISIAKLPLLEKISQTYRPNLLDYLLFSLVMFVLLFNSRLQFTLVFFQYLILRHYFKKQISIRFISLIPLIMFLVFIVFGSYRDYMSIAGGEGGVGLLLGHMSELISPSKSIDWFYGLNVEVFTGLSGLIATAEVNGGLNYDYGLNIFSFLPQFIPGAIRNDPSLPFIQTVEFFRQHYPYQGSIVSSGLEISYASFSFIGVILFGSFLGYFSKRFHEKLVFDRSLLVALVSVQLINSIRGTLSYSIYLVIAEFVIYKIYRSIQGIRRWRRLA